MAQVEHPSVTVTVNEPFLSPYVPEIRPLAFAKGKTDAGGFEERRLPRRDVPGKEVYGLLFAAGTHMSTTWPF